MKIFRTDLQVGLNNKLFEISSTTLGLDKINFTEDKFTCSIHSERTSRGYYLKGKMALATRDCCDRCLIDFDVKSNVEFSILLTSDPELVTNDEHEVIFFNEQEEAVDISPIMAEYIMLDRPLKMLCTADCKGLCPGCGCNKNEDDCTCTSAANDTRWEVLKDLHEQ